MKHFVGRRFIKISLNLVRPSHNNKLEPASVPVMSSIPPKELSLWVASNTSVTSDLTQQKTQGRKTLKLFYFTSFPPRTPTPKSKRQPALTVQNTLIANSPFHEFLIIKARKHPE